MTETPGSRPKCRDKGAWLCYSTSYRDGERVLFAMLKTQLIERETTNHVRVRVLRERRRHTVNENQPVLPASPRLRPEGAKLLDPDLCREVPRR